MPSTRDEPPPTSADAEARPDFRFRSVSVGDWFESAFPNGPTPAQAMAWPAVAAGSNSLLVSPTGTGKTFAAFLAILDALYLEHEAGTLEEGLRCVYVSPLRSLGYDIERNLKFPLDGIREGLELGRSPVRIGVRTGDTSAYRRMRLRDRPPHLLITTPESLSLMLSQARWNEVWRGVEFLIVDEVHALMPTKRGVDLAISMERLAALANVDPTRIGLSATCSPAEPVARFLVGTERTCRVLEAPPPAGHLPPHIEVESLLNADEAPHRGLTYRRLLRRLKGAIESNRTTIIFANTRAFTERITHDLKEAIGPDLIAAHHSAIDAKRRQEVEAALKAGDLRAVVSSTSLELGVDIGTVDLSVLVGLPGSTSRCLQRVGRAGHRIDAETRGLLLASTPSEIAGAAVTAMAARLGAVEPLQPIETPLDVLCQQLIGMACNGDGEVDSAFRLVKRAAPMASLSRADFEACLQFLSGELAAPAGAYEPEPAATPRFTSPRLWKQKGAFGLRHRGVARWFRANVGTIQSEETVKVLADGAIVGSLEGAYADRLQKGDRFVLDGRAFEFQRLENLTVLVKPVAGDSLLPRWTSDRQGLSTELAEALARFREEARGRLADGVPSLRGWLIEHHELDPRAAEVLIHLFQAQEILSEIPRADVLLVERYPTMEGDALTFHAPLSRTACEALGRATGARLGRRLGFDVKLAVADLGWSLTVPHGAPIDSSAIQGLLTPDGLTEDVLMGIDRGDVLARRFRYVAATALMVLGRPEGGRTRVGGLLWVSNRLYPLVRAACPDHPLIRETRREVLNDLLDTPTALRWLESRPQFRIRELDGPSPFAAAWIHQGQSEPLQFESPEEALRRLHQRLMTGNT